MKYTTEQLELIAIMFRTQFGDKTLKEVFPVCDDDCRFDIKIGDLGIRRGRFSYGNDVDFYDCDNDSWVISFRYVHDRMMFSTLSLPHIPIDDIVKILNFEDKIGEK
jgi:hypothetical protein